MKKVIIITLLMTILATLFIGSGVCFADEVATYYYVKEINNREIPMYKNSTIEGNGVLMYIPSGYAYEYVGAVDNSSYVKIKYNGREGFISSSDFEKNCAKVTSSAWEGKYAYTFTPTLTSESTIDIFKEDNVNEKFGSTSKSILTLDKVYGYYHKENDNTYYFLVDFTVNNFGEQKGTGYIKASDTSLADFTIQSILPSSGYTAEITPPETTPSGDSTPTINPSSGDSTTLPATNNFERYVLIAVIAVLCVVIIILIFAPNKSKRRPQ